MKNCTITLDQETYNRICRYAKKLGLPVERVAAEALNEYIEQWDDDGEVFSAPEPEPRTLIRFPMAPASA